MARREMGHKLLARLGKTKLRPGGVEGTEWLVGKAGLEPGKRVLEVACNRGFTLIDLVRRFGVVAEGVDADAEVIAQAERNVADAGLEESIHVQQGDALHLPFADETFDVVLNEAMLTMLADKSKAQAVSEYLRVLKPGGRLLTHDVVLTKEQPAVVRMLRKVINVPAHPLTAAGWTSLFSDAGFASVTSRTGDFTLLTDEGIVRDEGVEGRNELVQNALNDDNFAQFSEMRTFFDLAKDDIGYIVVASTK